MPGCAGTPISWLRLEQLALGELGGDAASAAREHLDACDACRGAFDSIGADRRQLRPLRLEAARPRRRWWAWSAGAGGLALAAAALLLVFAGEQERGDSSFGPTRRVAIKGGGELVVGLIRDRGGVIDRTPTRFADGDRFKIAVTCTRPGRLELEAWVIQGGERFAPLGERVAIDCRNSTLLPGALSITGDQPALVCVSESPGAEACVELEPAAD